LIHAINLPKVIITDDVDICKKQFLSDKIMEGPEQTLADQQTKKFYSRKKGKPGKV